MNKDGVAGTSGDIGQDGFQVVCPNCLGTNVGSISENMEYFENEEGEAYRAPVCYLGCNDCDYNFTHHWEHDNKYLGADESEAFGWFDG